MGISSAPKKHKKNIKRKRNLFLTMATELHKCEKNGPIALQ